MWRGNDQIAQTTGVLPAEVRYVDVRAQQTLSDDGETTQPWTGGSWYGLCQTRR